MSLPPEKPKPPEKWFAEDVHPHDSLLRSYLRGRFPKVRDIDDVVQESYLRIWKARALHPIDSAKAFLFRIARNLALDTVRRGRNSPIDSVTDLAGLFVIEDKPDAASVATRQQEIEMLVEAIATLPPVVVKSSSSANFRACPKKTSPAVSAFPSRPCRSRPRAACGAWLRTCSAR